MGTVVPQATPADLAGVFDAHRRYLWGLCYRMVGHPADADDLVQETFVRAIQRPPRDTALPWLPWLVRVAMNLARDHLRRRRRRAYAGTWLPGPIEIEEAPPAFELPGDAGRSTEGRYELLESVSFAFLLALEALTPQQRAVLVLRDVCDYSAAETAVALGISEANVKTTLHRARMAMRGYEERRRPPSEPLAREVKSVLERFLLGLAQHDVAAVESLLAEDVRALSDGGEFLAARRIVVGRTRVRRLLLGLQAKPGAARSGEIRRLNGLPAIVAQFGTGLPRRAPWGVVRCELDRFGKIAEIHFILASAKLAGL